MRDGQVKDQAPASSLVLEVAEDLHVTEQLSIACCYAMMCPDSVSDSAEQLPQHAHHPIVGLGCTLVSCACSCVVDVKVHVVFFAATLSKLAIIVSGEGGEYGNLQT